MEEWKELELSEDKDEWTVVFGDNGVITIRYRKRQPKEPTHEEIMTKWWYIKEAQCWGKVAAYSEHRYVLVVGPNYNRIGIDIITRNKEYFVSCESADVPPEAK